MRQRIRCRWKLAVVLLALAGGQRPHWCDAAGIVSVGPSTQLRRVDFSFEGTQSFDEDELRSVLAQTWQGQHGKLRRKLEFLPFVDPVPEEPFRPLELQRDVVRLREFYRLAGFSATDVQYQVTPVSDEDMIDVEFQITEGRPFQSAGIAVVDSLGAAPETWLAPELHEDWREFDREVLQKKRDRFGQTIAIEHETKLRDWLRERGYPYASVKSTVTRDEGSATARQELVVAPGPRAKISSVHIEGTQKVQPDVVRDAIGIRPDDWYSNRKVRDGQRQILSLDLFRVVAVDLPPQPRDATVDLRVRVEEGKSRLLQGEFGYLSDAGLTARSDWTHRNWYGGGRRFTVTGTLQSGIWAIEDQPEQLARLALTLTQPNFLRHDLALVTSPFGEYRDDSRDESWRYGFNTSLAYVNTGWVQTATLKYELSARELIETRSGTDDLDFLEILADQLALVDRTTSSSLTLTGTMGFRDDPLNPRTALQFRPAIEYVFPSAWSTTQFLRADLGIAAYAPLGRKYRISARAAAGRLLPYGKSAAVAPEVDGLRKFLELREHAFTAGGSGDVRGWASQLLGPKFPDIDLETSDSTRLRADRYLPVTGLARLTASVELRMPFPTLSDKWGTHVFLDGGRVWTSAPEYLGAADSFEQERFFASTGFGIDRDTPVGPMRLSLGYMLNPSPLDVLRPQEYLDAFAVDAVEAQDTHFKRRLRVHFSIGYGL